jgi:protein-S-isoprenylcysteine O-methyltransferase Ste14
LLGVTLLLSTVREFYVAGRGTLAPWSPPDELVTTGLYGFSRNPMYVAVVLVLLGWAALFHSGALLVYAVAVATGFHLRVVFGEEPWLEQTHRASWSRYRAQVPRWFVGSRKNSTGVTP